MAVLLVDGCNLLGQLRLDRESDEMKQRLMQLLSSWARSTSSRVTCVFDGPRPGGFVAAFGSARAEFAAPWSADDRIAELVEKNRSGKISVVTADRGLASRVAGRRVTIVAPADFAIRLEATRGEGSSGIEALDWADYFSDPKNRNI